MSCFVLVIQMIPFMNFQNIHFYSLSKKGFQYRKESVKTYADELKDHEEKAGNGSFKFLIFFFALLLFSMIFVLRARSKK